ncbi:hypothetical protein JCM10212_004955 [Sporobolomyces blumeae]
MGDDEPRVPGGRGGGGFDPVSERQGFFAQGGQDNSNSASARRGGGGGGGGATTQVGSDSETGEAARTRQDANEGLDDPSSFAVAAGGRIG